MNPLPAGAKIVLGLMTLWAALYAFAALGMDLSPAEDQGVVFGPALRAASMLDVLLVFAAYAAIAFKSPRMRALQKTGWVFAMLFFYPFVVPVFWYLHVWRTATPPAARSPQ